MGDLGLDAFVFHVFRGHFDTFCRTLYTFDGGRDVSRAHRGERRRCAAVRSALLRLPGLQFGEYEWNRFRFGGVGGGVCEWGFGGGNVAAVGAKFG